MAVVVDVRYDDRGNAFEVRVNRAGRPVRSAALIFPPDYRVGLVDCSDRIQISVTVQVGQSHIPRVVEARGDGALRPARASTEILPPDELPVAAGPLSLAGAGQVVVAVAVNVAAAYGNGAIEGVAYKSLREEARAAGVYQDAVAVLVADRHFNRPDSRATAYAERQNRRHGHDVL